MSVVVAIAVVVLLGLGAMYISRTNFNMKKTNVNAKNNFYSAEGVLSDITTGLQSLLSEVYTECYTVVMEDYRSYTSVDEINETFRDEIVIRLVERLNVDEVSGSADGVLRYTYSIDALRDYVDATKYAGDTWTVEATDGNSDTLTDNLLDTLEDGVALRNVHITYTGKKGYFNEIYTDIKVSSPELVFSLISKMPDVAEYSIVAGRGLTVNGQNAVKMEGNVYAGTNPNSGVAVQLSNDSRLDLTKSQLTVADGILEVGQAATVLTGGARGSENDEANTSLWACDILLKEKAYAELIGRTYVKDDTTISGDNAKLYLGGQYYGYSNGTTSASESSSIVINGRNATLGMTSINTLLLAGTSFVGTSAIESGDHTNYDVLTGESITVKSNQLAYLVPTECVGVVTNPMSYDRYEQLITSSDWQQQILNTTLSSINRTIASYGEVSVVPVFSARDNGTVYLYISFAKVSSASNFFIDVYNSGSKLGSKLTDYMKTYLPNFQLKDGNYQIIAEGNYLIPAQYNSATGTFEATTYTTSSISPGSMPTLLSSTLSTYTALCKKLVTTKSSLTSDELSDGATVFSNLINEANIDAFFSRTGTVYGATITSESYGKKAVFDAGLGMQGIIVDNEGKSAYTVGVSGGSGIIIATGDVQIEGNFTGIIIAKGKISVVAGSVNNPVKCMADKDVTGKAMRFSCDVVSSSGSETTFSFLNFFKGGENYTFTDSDTDLYVDRSDVRNCVSYINWRLE